MIVENESTPVEFNSIQKETIKSTLDKLNKNNLVSRSEVISLEDMVPGILGELSPNNFTETPTSISLPELKAKLVKHVEEKAEYDGLWYTVDINEMINLVTNILDRSKSLSSFIKYSTKDKEVNEDIIEDMKNSTMLKAVSYCEYYNFHSGDTKNLAEVTVHDFAKQIDKIAPVLTNILKKDGVNHYDYISNYYSNAIDDKSNENLDIIRMALIIRMVKKQLNTNDASEVIIDYNVKVIELVDYIVNGTMYNDLIDLESDISATMLKACNLNRDYSKRESQDSWSGKFTFQDKSDYLKLLEINKMLSDDLSIGVIKYLTNIIYK